MHQIAPIFRILSMSNLPTTVPDGLLDKVMNRILLERSRISAIRRFIFASAICMGAMVSSVFVWHAFTQEILVSGFGQYLSLAFIDLRAVLNNWQDFGMSLLESFPAVNAAGLLAEAVILMVSIKFIVIYGKKYFAYGKLRTR